MPLATTSLELPRLRARWVRRALLRPILVDAQERVRALDTPRFVLAAGFSLAGAVVALHQNPLPNVHPSGPVAAIQPLIPLVVALLAAMSVLRPWAGLIAYVGLAPLVQTAFAGLWIGPFQIIVPTMIVAAVAAGAALGSPLPALRLPDREAMRSALRARRSKSAAWLLPGALLAIAVVSTILAPYPADAIPVALNGIVVPVLAGSLVVAMRPSRRQLWGLVGAIGVAAAIGSAVNVYQTVDMGPTLAKLQLDRVWLARLTYYNVGIFGQVLAASLPAAIAVTIVWARRLGRGFWPLAALMLAVEAAGLLLTFSKSAWLGSGVAVTLLLLAAVRTRKARIGVVLAASVLALLVIPYPTQFLADANVAGAQTASSVVAKIQGPSRYNSWNPNTAEGEISITERFYATQAAIRMALDHPLVGVGPAQFGAEYASAQYRPSAATRNLDSAHDFLAEIAAELGLVALAIVLTLFGLASWIAFRAWRSARGPSRVLAAGILASLIGWLVTAETFDVDLYRPWRFMNFDVLVGALLVGCAIALPRAVAARKASRAAAPR